MSKKPREVEEPEAPADFETHHSHDAVTAARRHASIEGDANGLTGDELQAHIFIAMFEAAKKGSK